MSYIKDLFDEIQDLKMHCLQIEAINNMRGLPYKWGDKKKEAHLTKFINKHLKQQNKSIKKKQLEIKKLVKIRYKKGF